jgi:hypothetical protein
MQRSNRFRVYVVAVLGVAICGFWIFGSIVQREARAQPDEPKMNSDRAPNARQDGLDESPADSPETYVDLVDGRTAKVVKSVADPRHYFVAPVFALVLPDTRLSDLPRIVHRKDPPKIDGAVTLHFTVLNSSDVIRNHARHRVMGLPGLQEVVPNIDRIEVRRWPIQSATVEVYDDRGLLASANTGDIAAQGDTFPISIPFRLDALARFIEASNADRVHFIFEARYVSHAAARGRLTLDAYSLASQQLELALAAKSTFAGDTIGHRDVNDLKELMTRTARAIIYADDSQTAERLLGFTQETVKQALSSAFIKEAPLSLGVDAIKNASETDRAALRKYFEPLIQDRWTKVVHFRDKRELARHLQREESEKRLSKFNLTIPSGSTPSGQVMAWIVDLEGGLGTKSIEEALKEIEEKYGITTEKADSERSYRLATAVDVYRLNRVEWRSTAKNLVELNIGRSAERKSLYSSVVRPSLAVDLGSRDAQSQLAALVRHPSEVHAPPFGAVRLGMCLPFFGKDLPEGYVWADGQSFWPNEEWVPDYLRGQPVPNLNGRVLRGCRDGNQHVAETGGTNSHSHRIPTHVHDLSNLITGAIAERVPDEIKGANYKVVRRDGQSPDGEFIGTFCGSFGPITGAPPQGQHVHKLTGMTGGLPTGFPAYVEGDDRTPEPGRSEQYVPSYSAVHYIIRVR